MANMAVTHILACKEIDVCGTVILQMLPSGARVFMMINFFYSFTIPFTPDVQTINAHTFIVL
jgi:hypothetical protein